MRPLKIALLSRWYWEEHRRSDTDEGGTTQQLAESVASIGHEVVVLSQSNKAKKLEKSRIGQLETWLSPREKRRDLRTALRDKFAKKKYNHRKVYSDALALRDFLHKRGPFDVLWAQTESPDGLVCAIAAELGVKLPPIVLQIQALRYHFRSGAPIFTEKLPLGLAFRQATPILANSELVAEHLHRYAMPGTTTEQLLGKTRIVAPNLQRAFYRATQDPSTHAEPMTDRVLFLGAINQGKGAVTFVQSILKTLASKRSAYFMFAGDFTEDDARFQKKWETLVKETRSQMFASRLELLGSVTPSEVIRQIRLARVVVIPSLFDAFSRALVEAISLGRPVITTDRVGAAPIVQQHQAGLVIPPNDPIALARAIDTLLGAKTPYAENARHIAPQLLNDYSPETIAIHLAYHLERAAEPKT